MKRHVYSSTGTSNKIPISELIPDGIMDLPDKVTLMTRIPGSRNANYLFKVVNRDAILENPDQCFFISSYWGCARSQDIYIASEEDVNSYMQEEIDAIERECKNYKRYAL